MPRRSAVLSSLHSDLASNRTCPTTGPMKTNMKMSTKREDDAPVQRRESRRTYFAWEHWHAVSASPRNLPTRWVRKTDAALFSGKRMDEDDRVEYRPAGAAVDPDDVLFLVVAPRRAILMNTIHC
ncbi:hypothetical protein KIF59_19710 [Enterobacter cloacae subsp. cloacae]|nr:hypothetical protein [Enterobacter cloacae subsp. cloacae]